MAKYLYLELSFVMLYRAKFRGVTTMNKFSKDTFFELFSKDQICYFDRHTAKYFIEPKLAKQMENAKEQGINIAFCLDKND